MKEDTLKRVELSANVAIIVTALLLCAVLVKSYIITKSASPDNQIPEANKLASRSNPRAAPEIQPGTKLSLAGMDWAKNGRTLLLAVSDKCHFCSESAPFYQRLVKEHGKTRIVAVLPQAVEEGKSYLDKLNVAVDDIRQVSLGSLGIRGTPTLILVDSSGATVKSWVGKLAADRQAEVFSSLQ